MCDPAHQYGNIDQVKVNEIITALRNAGATVTGNNPWNVDTNSNGVKLQGSWNSGNNTMTIAVTDKNFYVPCSKIWSIIDEMMHHISTLNSAEAFAA
ncbi:MAG: hypothetical protein SH848_13620 [Saprospiraceae bacterium]|nr:hypothetical protein [Saprospiraceae bacterium]